MPNKSHNTSFCLRLLTGELETYLDHMQVSFSPDKIEEIKEHLILQFQALVGVIINIIQAYPDTNYRSNLKIVADELTKYREKTGYKAAEWK